MSVSYIFMVLRLLCLINVSDCATEMDEDGDTNNDFDDITKLTTTDHILDTTFQVPDEKWTCNALKDIAHYLRNYKFNGWDQRYYSTKPDDLVGYYDSFPVPMLRSLHWKVYENCDSHFYKCITYLQNIIQIVPFSRSDDVVTLLNENAVENSTLIGNLNVECRETEINADRSSFPFDSPIEKFQWRTTASYYMCWYTMLGTPALSMLGETCDNFANCLDPKYGHRNRDPRSDDRLSFACAMYSFCPDPCCPLKHIENLKECHENVFNPCFEENREMDVGLKKCTLDRKENRNFKDIIRNKWNVSCNCKKAGFIWKSQYGMCVDINECLAPESPCENSSEDCLNTPGSYKCICKWGFELDDNKKKCVFSNLDMNFDDNLVVSKNSSIINIMVRLLSFIGIEI